MKYFKVSYSSDSLEGLSVLSGKQNSSGRNEFGETSNKMMPPPGPDSGTQDVTLNNAGPGATNTPPAPSIQNASSADQGVLNSDQVAPPPFPNSGEPAAAGIDGGGYPVPPMPNAIIENAAKEQSEDELVPPPSPARTTSKKGKK